jgi:hypothetical protein
MPDLFDDVEFDPASEWVGMPEFVQEKQEPHQTIVIRFRCQADVEAFAQAIGQRVTPKTKSLWYPPLVRGMGGRPAYVEEP